MKFEIGLFFSKYFDLFKKIDLSNYWLSGTLMDIMIKRHK